MSNECKILIRTICGLRIYVSLGDLDGQRLRLLSHDLSVKQRNKTIAWEEVNEKEKRKIEMKWMSAERERQCSNVVSTGFDVSTLSTVANMHILCARNEKNQHGLTNFTRKSAKKKRKEKRMAMCGVFMQIRFSILASQTNEFELTIRRQKAKYAFFPMDRTRAQSLSWRAVSLSA